MTSAWTRIGLRLCLASALAITIGSRVALAGELDGSHRSMVRQHSVAARLDYTFVRTPAQVLRLVESNAIETVMPSADLTLHDVSYPYARPEVHDFVERLAKAYYATTGTPLVVTSLLRPTSLQPGNASPLSVHPAGMAVDLRVPDDASARSWLEGVLLELENAGVLDVTRERRPPHLHVALFPTAFRDYTAPWDSVTVRKAVVAVPRQAAVATVSTTVPTGSTALPFALLLGFDVALVGGIVFTVGRGTDAA